MGEITAARRRQARRRRIAAAAKPQAGVLSLTQLYGMGVERWDLRAEVRAGRWRRWGKQTVRVADGDPAVAVLWRALFEVSPLAVLDGVTALQVAGLKTITADAIHVAVPKSSRPRRCRGVVVHETRRYEASSVVDDGIPRMQPATAAVHAALWARTSRQAALFVLASAQQRLFTLEEFGVEVEKIRRDRRRGLIRQLYAELAGGIEALGERDFARLCRRRGLPPPTRQLRRQTPSGTWVYDTVWEQYGVTAEINGSQHLEPEQMLRDALKQNERRLDGHVVIEIPNVALRVDPEPYFDQLEAALRRGGWRGAA
ncbi:hypothetical protein [Sporichthya polymorpha]|uniref:hypothetical protein n=1 Tax=Sporichthya polymorpha TaxID=35751 RepID=UPI0003622778|nr:hypothetical protein [Sporichthya polymorpha]